MMNFREMFNLKIIGMILMFALMSIVPVSSTVSILTRSQQTLPDWHFGYRVTFFEDGRFVYTICSSGDNKKTCTIVQEELLSGTTLYSCNVTLQPEQEDARPGKYFARSFGNDKAIFVWEEKGIDTFVKFVTVKLTSCESNEAKLLDTSKMQRVEPIAYQLYTSLTIATYEDYYDVFFKDTKRCGNRECKVSINSEGNIINGPSSFVSINQYQMVIVMQSIAKQTADKGFICVKFDWNRTYLAFVRPDGKEKSLARIFDDNEITGVVVQHETVVTCMIAEKEFKITCSQYDSDGNLILESTVRDIKPQTHQISLLALREGGFLIMFYQISEQTSHCMNVTHYWITKVDSSGKVIGNFQLKEFAATNIAQHVGSMYENPNDEGHCATVVYSKCDTINQKRKANNRHVITNCFTKADFSA